MANLSIKSKLLVMLLAVSAASIAIVAGLNYYTCYKALQVSVTSHLTGVRESRADQIEQFIERLRVETRVLGNSGLMTDAARQFLDAYRTLEHVQVEASMDASLREYYQLTYVPALAKATDTEPDVEALFPEPATARYLQYHYLAKNPFPITEKGGMDEADDPSAYGPVHAKFHPPLRRLTQDLGFIDAYIVDIENGVIVYSASKEPDFGTRLSDGPYSHTNLGELFRRLQALPDRSAAAVADFQEYRPTLGRPSAFIGTPVFQGGRPIAVLILQLSDEAIDRVMTGNRQWEAQGLGKSGETYLVGADFLMRSNSRFLIEDPQKYAAQLRNNKQPEAEVQRILAHNSTILIQRVRSYAAEQALAGNSGTGMVKGYRGIEMLGAWAPLHVAGLQWGIVAKIDREEAYAPMAHMARDTLIQTLLIALAITLAVMFLATSFVRPVNDLIARVRLARAGKADLDGTAESADEIGDLARSFRELIEGVRKQTRLLEDVTTQNQLLLENVMPKALAQRVKVGAAEITERIDEVTVVFAELRGLAEYTQATSDTESVAALKRVIDAFDEAAQRHGVERIKTVGDTYLAATGLSQPLLDHMRRGIEFALSARRIVKELDRESGAHLGLTVGIGSGPVIVDAIGEGRISFQLWGSAVIAADHAMDSGAVGDIVVSRTVYEGLADQYSFKPLHTLTDVPLWVLVDHE